MKHVHLTINLTVSVLREKKRFVAYSPALDLSTSGKSFKEVQSHFTEIVQLFFQEIEAQGTLDEVLENLGWTKVKKEWQPPDVIADSISIPVQLCHA